MMKKCPIFSVFCLFLNKEWSVWHYLYIFVNLSKRATTFVKRAKQVAVFPLPWEFWPKRGIGDIFVEHAVLFLNVVRKCHYLSSFLRYMPNRLWEPSTITRKNSQNTSKIGYKFTKNTEKLRMVPILAMTLQWLCSEFRVHHTYREKTWENY